jgi:hypothetical protein
MRHSLRVFQRAPGLEIGRDAGGSECMGSILANGVAKGTKTGHGEALLRADYGVREPDGIVSWVPQLEMGGVAEYQGDPR